MDHERHAVRWLRERLGLGRANHMEREIGVEIQKGARRIVAQLKDVLTSSWMVGANCQRSRIIDGRQCRAACQREVN